MRRAALRVQGFFSCEPERLALWGQRSRCGAGLPACLVSRACFFRECWQADRPRCGVPPPPRCRVNSGDMQAAAEHMASPLGSGRTSLQHHASPFSGGGSPRTDGVELSAVLVGGGVKPGSSPPPLSFEQQHLLAKKNTPATAAERALLLDRLQQQEAGGGSSAAGVSKVHQRASATGGPPSGTSPLGGPAAARNRLSSVSAV